MGVLLVQLVLGAIALALAVWLLGPVVGFFVCEQRLEVDVHPGEMLARPYPEDEDGLRRYHQLVELGFRPVGWTEEHARFFSPLHWHWRSAQGCRYLVSQDGRTWTSLYRIVDDEPVRFSAVTYFEDGGCVSTVCPGAGVDQKPDGKFRYSEERGIQPAELLERHAAYVERHQQERGVAVKAGTLAEVAESVLDMSRQVVTKQKLGSAAAIPLGLFLPSLFLLPYVARGGRGGIGALGGVIFMGLMAAALRMVIVKPSHAARHSHTREFDLEQTAVAADGTITVGRYEPWLRRLAVLAAADMVVRLAVLAWKLTTRLSSATLSDSRTMSLVLAGLIASICVMSLRNFVARASGRMRQTKDGKAGQPADLWSSWSTAAMVCFLLTKNAFTAPYVTWWLGAMALGGLGWWLEKNGRK
jgi:hypothetical protein